MKGLTGGGKGCGTVEYKKTEAGLKRISRFIVGEQCGLTAFHCTWISNSPVRWGIFWTFVANFYLFTQLSVFVM